MLLVYSPEFTSRIGFAFKLVLGNILGVDLNITTSEEEFKKHTGPKFVYGNTSGLNAPCIPAADLLFEKGIHPPAIKVSQWNDLPIFFTIEGQNKLLPFDIFAASFFLATRYEEYLPHETDKHGRFKYQQSIAFKHGFLEKPLLNMWAEELKRSLQNLCPTLVFRASCFKFISTFDIDIAYAYKGRSLSRTIQATAKNLLKGEFKQILERWPVLAGALKDPYDTFALQQKLQQQYHFDQRYFILCGAYGPYDKNLNIETSPAQRSLIKQLAERCSLGLHPSYASDNHIHKLTAELHSLEEASGIPITSSRQHFLKIKFPDTYRSLVECGIKEDHSMGYPDHIGFRASICTPYPFYDLLTEQETSLMIYPFAVMDNTMKDYMGLKPDEAITKTKAIIDHIVNVNGLFISIWHNHSLNEDSQWKGWLNVYKETIKYSTEKSQ